MELADKNDKSYYKHVQEFKGKINIMKTGKIFFKIPNVLSRVEKYNI